MAFNPQLVSGGHFVKNVRGLDVGEKHKRYKKIFFFCDPEEGDKS